MPFSFFFGHRIPMPFTCTLRPRSKEIEALIRSSGNDECVYVHTFNWVFFLKSLIRYRYQY